MTKLSEKYPIGSIWETRAGKKVIIVDHGVSSRTMVQGPSTSNDFGIAVPCDKQYTFFENGSYAIYENRPEDLVKCLVEAKKE